MKHMEQAGGFILSTQQIEALTKKAFTWDKENKPHVNKDFVGKDASVLAEAAGVRVPPATQLLCRRDEIRSSVRAGRTDDALRPVRARQECR